MRVVSPPRRRRSRLGLLVLALLTSGLLVSGLVGTLWLLGVPLAFWRPSLPAPSPWVVRIPINVRPIAAYSRVERADLLDPETGGLKYQVLPPQSVVGMAVSGLGQQGQEIRGRVAGVRAQEDQVLFVLDSGETIPQHQADELGGALLNAGAIIGRVLKKDKSPGLGFRAENFLPLGTPEGIAGATPPGMRSLVVGAERLQGIHTLPAGARIDLLANVPLDDLSSFDSGHNSRLSGAALVLSSAQGKSSRGGKTEPVLLAQEALVLKPVYQRVEAAASSSLTQGKRVVAMPVYEVALAVHPGDVIPLQSALNKELEVICVAHSMQPVAAAEAADGSSVPRRVAPVTSRSILAYEVLTRDYFADPATRQIRYEPATDEEFQRLGIVESLEQLVGAVVRHDIPKGSFITQADLLRIPRNNPPPALPKEPQLPADAAAERSAHRPAAERAAVHRLASQRQEADSVADTAGSTAEGAATDPSRGPRPHVVGEVPGISQFIPPGHQAVALPWNRLYGAEHLQLDDVVDLTVSYSLEYEAESQEQERRPDGTVIDRTIKRRVNEPTQRTSEETLGFRGEPWFAALNARVIGPVGFPPPAAATRFLGDSLFQPAAAAKTDDRTGPPIVLAIAEEDVEAVSAALATKEAVFSLALRGPAASQVVPAGWKRVVLAPEGLAACERVTSQNLAQSHTRRWLTRLVPENDPVFASALTEEELRPLLGRVLRSYKERRGVFFADDFFPPEVPPGLAANLRPGHTAFVAADGDIDGLEHLRDQDRVAILYRGLSQPPQGAIHHGIDSQQPVARVIVPLARVLRASQVGKTVLEIANDDLARLQASWAESFAGTGLPSDNATTAGRRNLVAVSLPTSATLGRSTPAAPATPVTAAWERSQPISDYDPGANLKVLEAVVGKRRQLHIFPGPASALSETSLPLQTARQ